jgi:hypothetical protein
VTRCDCHDWHDIREIGGLLVDRAGFKPVRGWASEADIWQLGNCELSREELFSLIRATGGIRCEPALQATTRLSGEIDLSNGVHCWAVAAELGIRAVPVQMIYETEPVWAWGAVDRDSYSSGWIKPHCAPPQSLRPIGTAVSKSGQQTFRSHSSDPMRAGPPSQLSPVAGRSG